MTAYIKCGWHGTLTKFLSTGNETILKNLQNHHIKSMKEKPGTSQINAWKQSVIDLKDQVKELVDSNSRSEYWNLILEYEIPRERGRRPDVILLAEKDIFIFEFKRYNHILQSHVDQVASYSRDIQHYHSESHNYWVHPILVLTKFKEDPNKTHNVDICDSNSIAQIINTNTAAEIGSAINVENWLSAEYVPLPSLVTAARYVFKNEKLPNIKRASSAGIPDTIQKISGIANTARRNSERHLVIVTGVPGSGKTLVGLQFVYEYHDEADQASVFLSGNGPLVQVLQHALKSKVFVQDVHGFLMEYGGNRATLPREHIWVYDEAQRAWDQEKAQERRGEGAFSEPYDFLHLGERMDHYAVIVALIGEGQEIHIGEEAGIQQWNTALLSMNEEWFVHCPNKLANVFTVKNVALDDRLNLSTTLRSHIAGDTHEWVSCILNGDIERAKELSTIIVDQNYNIYISRDLDDCKRYLRERYLGNEEKRFGIMASSKAKNLTQYSILNDFNSTRNVRKGPWYNNSPSSLKSCCQLMEVVTEFGCQGLELDMPLIAWGSDLTWDGTTWQSNIRRNKARDPHTLRINSYRVLLTRGRDGLLVFVPEEENLDSTYEVLRSSGFQELKKKSGPILVTAGIIWKKNEILIAKRKEEQLWEFPGGKVDYGENPRDCLKREIKEELDFSIEVDDIVDSTSFIADDGTHYIIIFYNCRYIQGTPEMKKHMEIKWIDKENALEYNFLPADSTMINNFGER